MTQGTHVPQAAVPMPKGKRTLFIFASVLLLTGFSASGYGISVVLPQYLNNINMMQYYSLVSAIGSLGMVLALPLTGKLGGIFGLKRLSLFGVFMQFVTRLLMMFTQSVPLFTALYTVSQFCGGLYITAPYAMIADVVLPEERPKYYGLLTTMNSVGALIGPLLTGVVMDMGLVDIAFIIYVPIMVISVPFILAFYPNRKRASASGSKFDYMGIILMVLGMSALVLWLSLGGSLFAWASLPSVAVLAVGIVGMVLMVRTELHHKNPSVPITMFRKRRFRNAFIAQFMLTGFITALSAYGIAYAQQVMKVSAAVSSTVTMPTTIVRVICGVFIGGLLGKNFKKRFGPMALASMLMLTAGSVLLCLLQPTSSMMLIYVAGILGGFCNAFAMAAFPPFFQSELQPGELASAQGIFQVSGTVGPVVYIALGGALLNGGGGFKGAFVLATVMCAIGLVVTIFGLRFPKDEIAKEAMEARQ